MKPEDFIPHYGIRFFYHFTDAANVSSIKKHGAIYSLRCIKAAKMESVRYASDDTSRSVDQRYGLDAYVRLSLVDQHPMEYIARKKKRIENSVFLKIKPEIIYKDGVKFAAGVAYSRSTAVYDLAQACGELDFDILFQPHNWNDPEQRERLLLARKYEILVPDLIESDYIVGI